MKKTLFLFVLACASQDAFACAAEKPDWKPSSEQIGGTQTRISAAGIARLRAALPNCAIRAD